MPALRQVFLHDGPTVAASLARQAGVHKHDLSPGTRSLGNTEGLELAPASIKDRGIQTSFGAGSIGQIRAALVRVRFGGRRGAHVG
ncbi:MAG TPA: hypothetical protein VF099_08175, partial [Ktedonobacterales bacterium]